MNLLIKLNLQEAVRRKIANYLTINNISINQLSIRSGLTQSTLQSILNNNTKTVHMETLFKICCGMNMTLQEFFQNSLFDNLNDNF